MRRVLNILQQFKQNYLVVNNFLKNKTNCKVIFFSIPTEEFFAFQTYDVFQTVSNRIEQFQVADTEAKRKTLKLAWLTTLEKFNYPIQLIKSDEGYFCHPGTDRILVMTYLKPTKYIKGIYLWYPDLDPTPIFLNYKFKELTNVFQVLSKFKPSETLRFKAVQMNKTLDVSDKDPKVSNAMFATAKKYFNKVDPKFNNMFMSWHDNMQWKELSKINTDDLIKFDGNKCMFGSARLYKNNGKWIKE